MRREERSRSTKRPSRDVGLQHTRQGSPMRRQAARIASTRQEEFLLLSDSNLGAVIHRRERSYVDSRE